MDYTLGPAAYSFQYSNQTQGVTANSRTISGLNLNTEANDDGITPAEWFTFFNNVMTALGLTFGATQPKLIETRRYEMG